MSSLRHLTALTKLDLLNNVQLDICGNQLAGLLHEPCSESQGPQPGQHLVEMGDTASNAAAEVTAFPTSHPSPLSSEYPLMSQTFPISPSPHQQVSPPPLSTLKALSLGSVGGMAQDVQPSDELLALLPALGNTLQVRLCLSLRHYSSKHS